MDQLSSRMTWEEICLTHPSRYVVLCPVDVEERTLVVRGGIVVGQGKDRKEAFASTPRAAGAEAILYTGRIRGNFSLSFPLDRIG